MNDAQARDVLLIRAIELSDVDGTVIAPTERQRASDEARRHAQGNPKASSVSAQNAGWSEAAEAFVSRRADLLLAALVQRYPVLGAVTRMGRGRGWRAALLPMFALILGLASNELGGGKRINIVFFPLLGLLLWNLAVYALLLFQSLRGAAVARAGDASNYPLRRLIGAAGRAMPSSVRMALEKQSHPLGAGIERYTRDVFTIGAPLYGARTTLILHLSAALFAAGAVAGMYAGGLGLEYLAGWESTFLDEAALAKLLDLVLGPASALTGIALPDAAHLATLRWSAAQAGENAARWIHLYAVTAALFIIVPRGLLAVAAWRHERRLCSAYPMPSAAEPYFRRLLAAVRGGSGVVRVVCYSYHLSAAVWERLRQLLSEVLGERMQVEFSDAIAYGAEDDYLAMVPLAPEAPADYLIVVFNLAATPEAENHGMLMRGLHGLVLQGKTAHHLVAVLDESAYRQRLAGEAGASRRLAQRRAAWQEVLHTKDLVAIDLESSDRAPARSALESVLAAAATTESVK